ncbi:MAG: HemK2/MTQ2 family protein methyltransferase [Candidatus Micrarchaeota archaeon]
MESYKGFSLEVLDDVYPPSDDSFLLADAAAFLRGSILEIGCGCGIASISCAKAHPDNFVLGIDINPSAVKVAKQNADRNRVPNALFSVSDLFSKVGTQRFDAILFNPPYLPTADDETVQGPLNHAFDGGADGRKVLDRFLNEFDTYLKPGGTLLLIQSSLNGVEKTQARLEGMGYKVRMMDSENFFFESIFLLKAEKPQV